MFWQVWFGKHKNKTVQQSHFRVILIFYFSLNITSSYIIQVDLCPPLRSIILFLIINITYITL